MLLLHVFIKAQDVESFNRIYNRTYVETSQKDFNKAVEIADSLYKISETPLFRAKSLMLSASLYEQATKTKKAIEFAKRAEKELKKTNEYAWKTRVFGFLATQHRMLSLYKESESYINIAIENAEKIPDHNASMTTLAFLKQEKALGESDRGNTLEAIESYKEAGEYFEQVGDQYLILQNIQYIGLCYLKLEEYDKAEKCFETILEGWGDLPESYVKSLTYIGMAEVHLAKNRLNEAKSDLEKAEELTENSNYLEVLAELSRVKIEYYTATNNTHNLTKAIQTRDSIKKLTSTNKSEYIDESYSELRNKNINTQRVSKNKNYIILFAGFFIMAGLCYVFWYKRKKKREIENIQGYIAELKKSKSEKSEIKISVDEKPLDKPSEVDYPENLMTVETEEKILKYLNEFETENLFLNRDVSLSWLASHCKTNNKYLSHYLNRNKGKDFNYYINELRINYIILKLINEPVYRKYKIATLAEETGFSSPNKFSTVFKQITSSSPSAFIKQLDESE